MKTDSLVKFTLVGGLAYVGTVLFLNGKNRHQREMSGVARRSYQCGFRTGCGMAKEDSFAQWLSGGERWSEGYSAGYLAAKSGLPYHGKDDSLRAAYGATTEAAAEPKADGEPFESAVTAEGGRAKTPEADEPAENLRDEP